MARSISIAFNNAWSLLSAVMDAHKALRRDPCFAGITESIVDIGDAVDPYLPVKMAVSVNVNLWIEPPQLDLQLRRTQDRIKKLFRIRNESRHQIDARQKVRV